MKIILPYLTVLVTFLVLIFRLESPNARMFFLVLTVLATAWFLYEVKTHKAYVYSSVQKFITFSYSREDILRLMWGKSKPVRQRNYRVVRWAVKLAIAFSVASFVMRLIACFADGSGWIGLLAPLALVFMYVSMLLATPTRNE